ncbi:translation initiation factor IF-2 subunit beta [Candidatus Woesearchaeota archaeon]|nr:translation initiation factor IF-2 subunit beta [Candidatus Woesearchaeota archaeon]
MTYDYDALLERAYSLLPESALSYERFEVPHVKGHIQGNRTIVSNFGQICSTLRREPQHTLKYLQRELATPASLDGPRLILGRKIGSQLINTKIEQYVTDFVICHECGKPDTKIVKEAKVAFLRCLACGAKHPIKSKI